MSRKPAAGAAIAGAPDDRSLRERLQSHLRRFGLKEVEERVDEHLAHAQKERPSYLAFLEAMLAEAASTRRQQRIDGRFLASGLKVRKTLAAFQWSFQPKLDRALVEDLATLQFVERKEDVVITGKAGAGKSHILQSMVMIACEREITVRYARCADLLDDLYAGLADGTYQRRLKRWCRPALLIIDDVGLGQVKKREDEATAAHTLFNLIDRRHTYASTGVTSNIKLSAWGKYLGDSTLAAAILDRLIMNATRIDIDGPSYRQHLASLRAVDPNVDLGDEQ